MSSATTLPTPAEEPVHAPKHPLSPLTAQEVAESPPDPACGRSCQRADPVLLRHAS